MGQRTVASLSAVLPAFTPAEARALGGPSWLASRRVEAAERFASADSPTTAAEEWRYSNVDDLDLAAFAPDPTPAASGRHRSDTPAPQALHEGVELPAATVRCVNGVVTGIELSPQAAASGVTIARIGDHTAGAALLGSLSAGSGDYFTLLNDAFAAEPLLVAVPAGVALSKPIVVSNHSTGTGTAVFPRLFVKVGADAEASVVEVQSSDDSEVLVCPVVELDVADAGRLNYLNVQTLGGRATQIGSQLARAGRDSTISAATAAFGGAASRSRADTRLVGSGAHGDLMGVYFADHDQTLDFRTYQDHVAQHTTSNLLYKGVVADRSRSIYTGLIRIRPEARGVEAFQTNRNLKLSEDAWAKSVPNLEIENNDVRCSHASAVTPVDPEQRFYIESRGVPTVEAERLVVAGFLGEVIDKLAVPAAAEQVRGQVAAKLETAARHAESGAAERSLVESAR